MAGNKGTILIRNSCPHVPSYAETGGGGFNLESVKWMLTNLQPDRLVSAGAAYVAASDALAHASVRLHQLAHSVVEAWSGKDADLALKQLGQLNTTAAELQEKSAATGRTYNWLGTEILPWYKAEGERMGDGHIRTGGDDQAALEMLDRMNNRIVQGFNAMPAELTWDLPPAATSTGYQGSRGDADTGKYGFPPGGGVPPSGILTGPPSGGILGDPAGPPGTLPDPTGGDGLPNDPGGDLPGHPDVGGGGLPGTGGTSLAGMGGGGAMDPFGAGGLGAGGGAAGGAPGGLGGGLGGGVLGPGATGPFGAGRKGSAGDGATGRSTGKSGSGVPMGGAGAGGGNGEGEEERERTTWLTEDEDIWTDHGDVAPPVIG
jgi:hypothetical protein